MRRTADSLPLVARTFMGKRLHAQGRAELQASWRTRVPRAFVRECNTPVSAAPWH